MVSTFDSFFSGPENFLTDSFSPSEKLKQLRRLRSMSLEGHSSNTYRGQERRVACTQGPGGSTASRRVPVPCFCCEQTSLWGDKHRWGGGEGLPSPRRRDLGSHSGSTGHHTEEKETPYTRTELPPRGQGPAWLKQTLLGPLPLRCRRLQ